LAYQEKKLPAEVPKKVPRSWSELEEMGIPETFAHLSTNAPFLRYIKNRLP